MAEGGVDPWLPNLTYRKAERQPNISALPLQQNFPGLWPHLPGLRGPRTRVVNLSTQALRIFSGVAGLSSRKSAFALLAVC